MANVMVKIPEKTLQAAGLLKTEVSAEVNGILILELYHEGKISLGKAAELAEMSLVEFMDFMAGHHTYLNYSAADLQADEETTKRLKL